MKTITKRVEVPCDVDYYIADDDTEFLNKKDCLKYESDKLCNEFDNLESIELHNFEFRNPSNFDTAYYVHNAIEFNSIIRKYSYEYEFRSYNEADESFAGEGWYLLSLYDGCFISDDDYDEPCFYITYLNRLVNDYLALIKKCKKI